MENSDLAIIQGQNLTVPLSNCLDSAAKCQLKIFRVKHAKIRRDNNRFRAASGISSMRGDTNEKHYLGHLSSVMLREK